MNMKRVQSKQEAQLYEFGPLASILSDRGISSRAHSHISCTSLMSAVRISSVKRKVFGGERVSWARRPSLPIVKDISVSLTAQSINLLREEGASLSLSQQVIALAALLTERQALSSS